MLPNMKTERSETQQAPNPLATQMRELFENPLNGTALDESRIRLELALKGRELDLQAADLALRERSARGQKWANPLTAGVLVALVGVLGAWVNGAKSNEIEDTKLRNDLIRDAIKNPKFEDRVSSLIWYSENGLVNLPRDTVVKLKNQLPHDPDVVPTSPGGEPSPAAQLRSIELEADAVADDYHLWIIAPNPAKTGTNVQVSSAANRVVEKLDVLTDARLQKADYICLRELIRCEVLGLRSAANWETGSPLVVRVESLNALRSIGRIESLAKQESTSGTVGSWLKKTWHSGITNRDRVDRAKLRCEILLWRLGGAVDAAQMKKKLTRVLEAFAGEPPIDMSLDPLWKWAQTMLKDTKPAP